MIEKFTCLSLIFSPPSPFSAAKDAPAGVRWCHKGHCYGERPMERHAATLPSRADDNGESPSSATFLSPAGLLPRAASPAGRASGVRIDCASAGAPDAKLRCRLTKMMIGTVRRHDGTDRPATQPYQKVSCSAKGCKVTQRTYCACNNKAYCVEHYADHKWGKLGETN